MKKKVLAAILILASIIPIWIGATWYDVPVKKEIRGNVNWSNWH